MNGGAYADLEKRPGVMPLAEIKRARGTVASNPGASLVDLGDGVLCLEFHSKMNTLGDDMVRMVPAALDEVDRGFIALVIANDGENFSVGANLMMVLVAAQEGRWEELDTVVRRFQAGCMALKIRVAPCRGSPVRHGVGRRLRSGLTCRKGAGIGRDLHRPGRDRRGPDPRGWRLQGDALLGTAKRAFDLIGFGKVSESAAHARELGFLRESDGVTMNRERLTADAKAAALALCGVPNRGPAPYIAVESAVWIRPAEDGHEDRRRRRLLTEYDCIGRSSPTS